MNTTKDSIVISVRTNKDTSSRLTQLAQATHRSRSALVGEALTQYVDHQDWLKAEIERGIIAAEQNELVKDDSIAAWINSLQK